MSEPLDAVGRRAVTTLSAIVASIESLGRDDDLTKKAIAAAGLSIGLAVGAIDSDAADRMIPILRATEEGERASRFFAVDLLNVLYEAEK